MRTTAQKSTPERGVNVHQQLAANPLVSAWVSANAGTGKTKVLTDRVLRLMLEGSPPERILCLTYTKAAAAEMANRIQKTLLEWLVASQEALEDSLWSLTNEKPDAETLSRARQLFAQVADAPEGLRVQTIHSFCQSLLQRFAVEANVSPYFEVMDEREAQAMIAGAKRELLSASQNGATDAVLLQALNRLARSLSESQFDELVEDIIANRSRLSSMLGPNNDSVALLQRTALKLGIGYPVMNFHTLLSHHFNRAPEYIKRLRAAIPLLEAGRKTDQEHAACFRGWVEALPQPDEEAVRHYLGCFITNEGTPRKNLATKDVLKKAPELEELLLQEQQSAIAFRNEWLANQALQQAEDSLTIAQSLLAYYAQAKRARGVLDYEDLIVATRHLLKRSGVASWVLYKLDGGLDHILVDEAQDTSAVQWELVETLANEFFSGQGVSENQRTLFVVGDEKQSIYSFQGAEPDAFTRMRHTFKQRIEAVEQRFEQVDLNLSYRSTPAVLKLVDAVFENPEARRGVIDINATILHAPHRDKEPGYIELWPLLEVEEEEEREPWSISATNRLPDKPEQRLAERIANTIAEWLRERRLLASTGQPVRPGDILILVQRRSVFFHFLVAALKKKGVPTSGADRLLLGEHIAVQDLLAFADFLLLPEDDLTLACVMKSPLFGVGEKLLLSLCHGRKGTLWDSLQHHSDPLCKPIAENLQYWLGKVDYLAPFDLFSQLLDAESGREKFLIRMGPSVSDPLDEFLSLALDYERTEPPSLQGFLRWFRASEMEIKRDLDAARDEVRIMTVHGAKGLEAPIVFLPDTVTGARERGMLFWQEDYFLPAFRKEDDPALLTGLKENRKQRAAEESRRLLYVALTRARDEIYIGGWVGKRKLAEDNWYSLIKAGLQKIGETYHDTWRDTEGEGWRYRDALPSKALQTDRVVKGFTEDKKLPVWFGKTAAEEQETARILNPSQTGDIPPPASPQAEPSFYKRGTVTHQLLELLPDVPEAQRHEAGLLLARRGLQGAEEKKLKALVEEVLGILKDSRFAEVFAPGSQAEVPIAATVEHRGVMRQLSGRIDRLRVTPEKIWLLDYKTHRAVPDEVPLAYRHQLELYAHALEQIYPNVPIEAGILWTAVPILTPVDVAS